MNGGGALDAFAPGSFGCAALTSCSFLGGLVEVAARVAGRVAVAVLGSAWVHTFLIAGMTTRPQGVLQPHLAVASSCTGSIGSGSRIPLRLGRDVGGDGRHDLFRRGVRHGCTLGNDGRVSVDQAPHGGR